MLEPEGSPDRALHRLLLEKDHALLGARFAPFGGWRMPLLYSSIIDEHMHVRTGAGLFDVSHMGRFLLRGMDATRSLQGLVASDLAPLNEGKARYTVLLSDEGGILDDLIAYRRDDGFLLVVNAGNTDRDRRWIERHLKDDTTLDDLTDITALFALQGPAAFDILSRLAAADLSTLDPFDFTVAEVAGIETTIMRTGYTGEDGVELLVSHTDATALWRALLASGGGSEVTPCGLGARDTLRLEAALLLHGQDMDRNTDPYEAGLGWLVDLEKRDGADFVGREALALASLREPERRLIGLATDARRIPRGGDAIQVDGRTVGVVTSGSVSPVLGHPIALGYVENSLAREGTAIDVVGGSKVTPSHIVPRPFYRRGLTPIPDRPWRGSR
jgi:aminomethyltransferase